MYSTTSDKMPSRPVIVSQTQATREFSTWVSQNEFQRLTDMDGLVWTLSVSVSETPDPDALHTAVYVAHINVTAPLSLEQLEKSGTLVKPADERLMSMLAAASATIPFKMRPVIISANNIEELRTKFAEAVVALKSKFASTPLRDVKRQLVCRFIDDACQFQAGAFFANSP